MKINIILIILLSCLTIGLHAQAETTHWENGNIKRITSYNKDGEKAGYWEEFYESGQRKEAGYYKNGKKSGTWNEYYYDGTIKKKTSYYNGFIEDIKTYFDNGRLMVSGRFDNNGKKHGLWTQYHENWQQKLEGDYAHGKKEGQWKYYKKSGKLFKVENYKDGIRISKWEGGLDNNNYVIEDAAEAIEETVIEDVEVEIVEVAESDYLESAEDAVEAAADTVVEAASDATEKSRYYGNRLNGEWKFYNDKGKIIEIGNYINDKKDGKWTYYYDNGQLKKEELWKQGTLMEILSYFDKKGNTLDKGTFKNGSGTVKEYDTDNKLISTTEYSYGKALDWNNWSQLNTLAWGVYENETDSKAIKEAIKWVKRSVELDKNYYNTDTYAALLYKTGNYKQALSLAKEAIEIAKKDKNDYSATTKLVAQILQKMK